MTSPYQITPLVAMIWNASVAHSGWSISKCMWLLIRELQQTPGLTELVQKTWQVEQKKLTRLRHWVLVRTLTSHPTRVEKFSFFIFLEICSVLSIWIAKEKALRRFRRSPTWWEHGMRTSFGMANACYTSFWNISKYAKY
jgi:hypothetical protein